MILHGNHLHQIMGEKLTIFKDVKLALIKGALEDDTQDPINVPFSVHELNDQIAKLRMNKSPGNNMTVNEFLIHLTEQVRIILLTVFNGGWVTKEGLTSDKLSELLPVLKPNKDLSLNTSYRAITLLSVLGKLFERLVHVRLYWWWEKNLLLPDYIYSSRTIRCTTDILLQLEHIVYRNFKVKKVTFMAFFYFKDAFDRTSHTGILFTLCRMGLRGYCLHYSLYIVENFSFPTFSPQKKKRNCLIIII